MSKARQKLSRLQAQVAAGTFTRSEIILRKAKQAAGRTHDLRGIFTFELVPGPQTKQLLVHENASAIQDDALCRESTCCGPPCRT